MFLLILLKFFQILLLLPLLLWPWVFFELLPCWQEKERVNQPQQVQPEVEEGGRSVSWDLRGGERSNQTIKKGGSKEEAANPGGTTGWRWAPR